jgi:hypothetical protein
MENMEKKNKTGKTNSGTGRQDPETLQVTLREALFREFSRLNREHRAQILGMAEAFLYCQGEKKNRKTAREKAENQSGPSAGA